VNFTVKVQPVSLGIKNLRCLDNIFGLVSSSAIDLSATTDFIRRIKVGSNFMIDDLIKTDLRILNTNPYLYGLGTQVQFKRRIDIHESIGEICGKVFSALRFFVAPIEFAAKFHNFTNIGYNSASFFWILRIYFFVPCTSTTHFGPRGPQPFIGMSDIQLYIYFFHHFSQFENTNKKGNIVIGDIIHT
jgi:hypothetical protein